MARATILIFVALATILLVLAVQRPEFIEKIWLWIIGLIGVIIRIIQEIVALVKRKVKEGDQE